MLCNANKTSESASEVTLAPKVTDDDIQMNDVPKITKIKKRFRFCPDCGEANKTGFLYFWV